MKRGFIILILVFVLIAGIFVFKSQKELLQPVQQSEELSPRNVNVSGDGILDTEQSEDECEDLIKFDYPPVNLDKTRVVVPLGLMSGSHVTPVDHHYFQDFDNEEADIEVYSPGEGIVTEIQHMFGEYFDGNNGNVEWADYRLIIDHGCGVSSIYIHIDVLSDKIAEVAPERGNHAKVNVPVEAGEVIGYYSQNVDYNLVDEDFVRGGFVIPEHYDSEPWKIHVPNTYDYFNEEIRVKLIEKSLRDEEPYEGKFDHDIDGKLIGNWFLEGTGGYGGTNRESYWRTHLSISPNYLDFNQIVVSLGDYDGKEAQFGVRGNSPDPAEVDVENGLVIYELVDFDYITQNGEFWDRKSLVKGLRAKNYDSVQGTVLIEMIEDRKIRVEVFPGKSASEIVGFTEDAKIYER